MFKKKKSWFQDGLKFFSGQYRDNGEKKVFSPETITGSVNNKVSLKNRWIMYNRNYVF